MSRATLSRPHACPTCGRGFPLWTCTLYLTTDFIVVIFNSERQTTLTLTVTLLMTYLCQLLFCKLQLLHLFFCPCVIFRQQLGFILLNEVRLQITISLFDFWSTRTNLHKNKNWVHDIFYHSPSFSLHQIALPLSWY